jgi:hypothetical protein
MRDIDSALDLWQSIDIEHYTCGDGFGLVVTDMVPMLCSLIDLLSIKVEHFTPFFQKKISFSSTKVEISLFKHTISWFTTFSLFIMFLSGLLQASLLHMQVDGKDIQT